MDGETVWLSLNQIAALFGRDKSTISRHIKNIFVSDEFIESSVVAGDLGRSQSNLAISLGLH
jgi:hypothetical protein